MELNEFPPDGDEDLTGENLGLTDDEKIELKLYAHSENIKKLFSILKKLNDLYSSDPIFNSHAYRCRDTYIYDLIGRKTTKYKFRYHAEHELDRISHIRKLTLVLFDSLGTHIPEERLYEKFNSILADRKYTLNSIVLFNIALDAYAQKNSGIINKVLSILDGIELIFKNKKIKALYDNNIMYQDKSTNIASSHKNLETNYGAEIYSPELSDQLTNFWKSEQIDNSLPLSVAVQAVIYDYYGYTENSADKNLEIMVDRYVDLLKDAEIIDYRDFNSRLENLISDINHSNSYNTLSNYCLFLVLSCLHKQKMLNEKQMQVLENKCVPIIGSQMYFSYLSYFVPESFKSGQPLPNPITKLSEILQYHILKKIELDIHKFSFNNFYNFLKQIKFKSDVPVGLIKHFLEKFSNELQTLTTHREDVKITEAMLDIAKHMLQLVSKEKYSMQTILHIKNMVSFYDICEKYLPSNQFKDIFHSEHFHSYFEQIIKDLDKRIACILMHLMIKAKFLKMELPEINDLDDIEETII